MKSNLSSSTISAKKGNILLGVLLVIAIIIIVILIKQNSTLKKQIENTIPEITPEISTTETSSSVITEDSSTVDETNNETIDEEQNNYIIKCSEYNHYVDQYNLIVNNVNRFIEETSKFSAVSNSEKLSYKEHIKEDYSKFVSENSDYDKLEKEMQDILKSTITLNEKYHMLCKSIYENTLQNYNELAQKYNNAVNASSIDFITDMPKKVESIESIDYDKFDIEEIPDEILKNLSEIQNKIDTLTANYVIIKQITAPNDNWVLERLGKIEDITEKDAVKSFKDPGGLLGKEGGYIGCIYFALKEVDQSSFGNKSIVAKGTDAGGAIEIYPNLQDAKNRCEYLSQFDGTLLYSGSYAIVGTMVIRISYKLSDEEQIKITDSIIKELTSIQSE